MGYIYCCIKFSENFILIFILIKSSVKTNSWDQTKNYNNSNIPLWKLLNIIYVEKQVVEQKIENIRTSFAKEVKNNK